MPEAAREQALRRLPKEIHEEYFAAEFGAQVKDPDAFAAEGSVLSMDSDDNEEMALLAEAEIELDAGELHHSGGPIDQQDMDEGDLNAMENESEAGDHELPMFEPEPFEDWVEEAGSEEAQEELAVQPKKRPASQKASAKSKAKGRAAQKKPAARKPRPNELCPDMPSKPCTFSTTRFGTAARIHPERGEKHCMFCSVEAFEKAYASDRPKVVPTLRKLPEEDRLKALTNIENWQGPEMAQEMKSKVAKAKATPKPKEEWKQLLEVRKPLKAPMEEEEQIEYEQAVRKDRQRARRKVMCPEHKGKHGTRKQEEKEIAEVRARFGEIADLATNDCGLPAPQDPTARMLEAWRKQGSWVMCNKCHSLQPQNLEPMDLKRVKKATMTPKKCTACRHEEYVPALEDVPPVLRNLAPEVLQALRLLDINTGGAGETRVCNSFSRHDRNRTQIRSKPCFPRPSRTSRLRISGAHEHDLFRMGAQKCRRKARAALNHLLSCRDSDYSAFYDKHLEFLHRHGKDAEEKLRKRPLRYIEQEGCLHENLPEAHLFFLLFHTTEIAPPFVPQCHRKK